MGVIAEKRGKMKCDMTPVAWSHFILDSNKSNNYDFNEFKEILHLFYVHLQI